MPICKLQMIEWSWLIVCEMVNIFLFYSSTPRALRVCHDAMTHTQHLIILWKRESLPYSDSYLDQYKYVLLEINKNQLLLLIFYRLLRFVRGYFF